MIRSFQPIILKQKSFSEKGKSGYKVFSAPNSHKYVEAETVSEAIEKSGIKKPLKVVRANLLSKDVLLESEVSEMKINEPAPPQQNLVEGTGVDSLPQPEQINPDATAENVDAVEAGAQEAVTGAADDGEPVDISV